MPQKYNVNQTLISSMLSWVSDGEIAIPEIQRPFVWDSTKVRDLMDSLYQGYPIGYIIIWKNPDVRLKDGSLSSGKKILIDGQQRITALRAAISGESVINKEYKEVKINIAFHPVLEKFETLTPAIKRDPSWIPNISEIMRRTNNYFEAVNEYCEANPDVDRKVVEGTIMSLIDIKNKQVGYIELNANLDIETVTEIFIRINSKGVVLSQADFAMSKIASYDKDSDFGVNLRKCVDYFCHLAKNPQDFKTIGENDKEFSSTHYFPKISWLKDENDDLYDPDYSDVLRVSFTKEFERGKLSDLVGLLSGRNFETRTFEEDIMDKSFQRLSQSVQDFVSKTHFQRFLMIIKSSGFISKDLITSRNALNFAYIVYLKLRDLGMHVSLIEKYTQKWFVMSILTGRYSGSSESWFDYDIKSIARDGIEKTLGDIEASFLADNYWSVTLVNALEKSNINSPYLNVFFATQAKANNRGFLSNDITVANMISHRGDIHHLFPKEYLKANHLGKNEYNQVANFVYAQSDINIKIGKKSPKEYMTEVYEQCSGGEIKHGGIVSVDDLKLNLYEHSIPEEFAKMTISDYENFLGHRRILMAQKIKGYYKSLG